VRLEAVQRGEDCSAVQVIRRHVFERLAKVGRAGMVIPPFDGEFNAARESVGFPMER